LKHLLAIGRIFFGLCIAGIGVFHFVYPGIQPIIIPNLRDIPPGLYWIGYLTGLILIGIGLLIVTGKKFHAISLIMGVVFLALLLFAHLPAFFIAGPQNSETWVKMNKVLALSGGFFLVSTINAPTPESRILITLYKLAPIGIYLFAMMLYNFGVGHLVNMNGISTLVPKYIPFPKFWTFMGGIALIGPAISIFTGIKTKEINLALAAVLFIWLLMLHVYYTVRFPQWNYGENFMGVITCLAFCGIALIIAQRNPDKVIIDNSTVE
jgi:uncharacterized membrane protein YphA (DoxX/SURF4 family)